MTTRPGLPALGLCALALAAAAGCGRPGGPFQVSQGDFPVPDAGTPPPIAITTPPVCTPARSSQMIPARSSLTQATGSDAGVQQDVEFTSDLFNLFKSVCGNCHVESNLGMFQVTATTFPKLVTSDVLAIIKSNTPGVFMPPDTGGGEPFSQRQPSDAVFVLATLLEEWIAAGSPVGSFPLPTQASAGSAGYAVSPVMSAQLTNIGSCIPSKSMVGTNANAMDALDAMFAQATTLPTTLDQTDLVTLDSAALAKSGVISYAPTYPLWSDNAQKMRYVRVPKCQSIAFDKATQTLQIPPNTRFYKTFLKQVKDVSGNLTYRKIETRVIVSRPDTNNADGTVAQNALFGTYVWNQDETQATLLNDPLRDGKPFADRIFSYVIDEQAAAPIEASNPSNLQAALDNARITRHYALPGSERCVQCHMGSPSQSFILGFTPLQVARRVDDQGGVYEAATGDELTQLQRLIDYGVITGMDSPADVLPLEQAEGARPPRNQYELQAQAYMVGNCAHCHNPRGFPSVKQPELRDILVFLPGPGENQGIFQFPLDLTSPIRKRGLNQNVQMPYITPSLYDMPSDGVLPKYFCPDQVGLGGSCPDTNADPQWILAPWRSLIYRNTDTPYDYFDDYAPFPHMPLNTSGYDCRVAQMMGDWMVSIPARVKDPTKFQNALPISGEFPSYANDDPQPYQEAFPADPDYQALLGSRDSRLNQYHNVGFRYRFCPSTYTDDIVDPLVIAEVNANVPVTSDTGLGVLDPTNSSLLIMPPNLTPIRPHYVSFDDTDPPGAWFPRRPDWQDALVNPDVPTFVQNAKVSDNLNPDQVEDLTNVMNALGGVTLTADVRSALTQQVPFGLWDTSDTSCNFAGIPTAGSFTGAARPQWMTVAPPAANAPVFVESPGAAVFTTVCFNCHGIQADSKGLLADEITNLTGGDARVANLRDGLLGPTTAPGMNRQATFGDAAAMLGITTDDLTARYMAWMTLGGTEKHLPQDVLTEVSQSPVIGQVRAHVDLQGTPDMLRLGLSLCEQVADSDPSGAAIQFTLGKFVASGRVDWSDFSGLVDSNGDAEMWVKLCNLGNRPFVRVPNVDGNVWTATSTTGDLQITAFRLYWAQDPTGHDWYGANPVMDHNGNIATGVDGSTNLFPICVQKPTDPTELGYATAALQATKVKGVNAIPFCPDGFVDPSHQLNVIPASQSPTGFPEYVDGRKWAARGAINGALAVFLYLDQIERDPSMRQPLYTQCSLLQQSSSP